MAFPGRPPMVPGMQPVITQSYGFPPSMRMVPMGMPVVTGVPRVSTSTTIAPQRLVKVHEKKDDKEKKPVTTVFIGNISDRAPDHMVKQMLQRCGNVLSWKRVQGASGKLQAFGFCEYDDPESTTRCIRLLNDWVIADKQLVAKVDAKTKALLDDYKRKKRAKLKGEDSNNRHDTSLEEGEDEEEEELDEQTLTNDQVIRASLEALMREYQHDLNKEPFTDKDAYKQRKKYIPRDIMDKDAGLDDMEIEDDKKDLINREIKFFRDSHKVRDEDESTREKDFRERERERRRREEREREYERERERREREREREKERERERKEREKARTKSRSRSRERSRESSLIAKQIHRERREKEQEEEEELYERKKLERKLREKEAAYQERLRNWETRERKKCRDYEKDKEREDERRQEEMKEGRRLKEFLEDYEDLRDDPKYYKGSALSRRLKEREREIDADNKDRQREKEELEDIKRKLLEDGHPDAEEQWARLEEARFEHLRPRLQLEPEPIPEPVVPAVAPQPKMIPIGNNDDDDDDDDNDSESANVPFEEPATEPEPEVNIPTSKSKTVIENDSSPDTATPDTNTKRKKLTVSDVFNQDDDDDTVVKKRKLTLPDSVEDAEPLKPPTTAEEKRKYIKNLIERIPTAKEELFAYKLDWSIVDSTLMDKRIKPWVNKKMIEYIGEEEPTLTEFICSKVITKLSPKSLVSDVAAILDDEAEVFVVKMWRLLIYETEAKKAGISK